MIAVDMTRRGFAIDGNKLLNLYRQKGWSQQDLANQADLDVRTVAKLKRGGTCDARTLRALSQTLGVQPDVLLFELANPEPANPDTASSPSTAVNSDTPGTAANQPVPATRSESPQSGLRLDQIWKVIDLRAPYRFDEHASGVVWERYRVERTSDLPTSLTLPYLTWGSGIECLQKPESASWNFIVPEPGDIVHSSKHWELTIPLPLGSSGSICEVGPIGLRFIEAFHLANQQWWQTRIAYETSCLTVQTLFANDQPCKAVVASWEPPGKRKILPKTQNSPFIAADGTVACWQILNPAVGAFYKISWEC